VKKFILLLSFLVTSLNAHALEKSIAVAQIPNLKDANERISQLAESLELPLPPQMLTGQLGMTIMSPELKGVDVEKPITIYIGKPESSRPGPPSAVIRFTVTGDGSEYLDAVGSMVPEREELKPGVYKFPMGPPDMEGAPALFVAIKDSQALVGFKLSDIKELSGDLSDAEADLLKNLPGSVSITLNVDMLSAMLAEQIENQKKMMEAMKAELASGGEDVSDMFKNDPAAMMDSYATFAQQLLGQFETLILTLDVGDNVTLRTHVQGKADSTLAKIIEDTQPPSATISGIADPNSIMTFYGTIAGVDYLLEPYADWMSSMYESMGPPIADLNHSYRELIMGMKGLYKGGYNMLVLPPKTGSPLQLMGLYEINDKAQAQKYMEDSIKLQESQFEQMKDAGISVKINKQPVGTYNDTEVETYKLEYILSGEMGDDLPPPVAAMMTNLAYQIAYVDDYMLYGFGDVENIHRVIDHVKSGTAAAIAPSGFEDVSGEIVGYWNIDVSKFLAAMNDIMQDLGINALAGMNDVQANVRGLMVKELGGYSSLVRLTRSDIKGFMEMGQKLTPKRKPGNASPMSPDQMAPFDDETFNMDDMDQMPVDESGETEPTEDIQ
jgi:hypothetical protein